MSYKIKKFIFLIFWIKTIFIIQAKADIIKANCLIDEYYLQEQKVDRSEQEVLAGRVIKLEIDTSKKLVFDKSDVKRIIILTGITEEGVKYEGSSRITYQNELKVMDQENNRELKYVYNNSISLENNEISRLNINLDQRGLSLNKWKFSINCRSGEYTDSEKVLARRTLTPDPNLKFDPDKDGNPLTSIFEKNDIKEDKKEIPAEFQILVEQKGGWKDPDSDRLMRLKAMLFDYDKRVSLQLKNKKYLKFDRGQQIFFEDIKDLNDRQFFRLPLENENQKKKLEQLHGYYKEKLF